MEDLQPRLAVDLGTTWTAASRVTDSGVEAVPLGSGHASMPSVVARDGDRFVVGEPAERVLDGRPESGAREVKRRFGDTTPVVIDGQPFGADALMAEILRHVARTAHPDGWSDVDVVLTHPANWGAYKLELLTNIGQEAGFRQVILQSEPVAAAAHFVESGRVQPGDVVAVYDFGGGTFDAAVVRVGENAAVLGTPQGLERLGGIDVDQMVFAHVAASLDGQLSQLDSNDPDVRRGVARLRAECTRAKEALSSDSDAMIPVSLPTIQTKVRITRPELEAILRQRVDETLATLDRAIASAGVTVDDLAAVVLVGGSSQIPLVAESVRAHTGRPTLFGNDPKLVVASGALEGAVRASRSGTATAATTSVTTAAAATASPKPTEEPPMTDASAADTAATAAAAAASAKRDKAGEVAATVVAGASGASEGTPPAAAPGAGAAPGSPSTTSAEHGSRTPAPPPPKPVASRAGRIAGGVAGAAAAVAGGIVFHEQLAAATGIDPQVEGDAMPGVMQVAGAAAAVAGAAGAAAVSLGDRDDADDAAAGASTPADVDTQLSSAGDAATDDDSMDAFDDGTAPAVDPRAPLAAAAGAADAAPVVDVPSEPAIQGDPFPPIDDFSTVVLPPSAPTPSAPDNPPVREPALGPKVGFTEPASRPRTPQFGDDDSGPRVPQPTSAPMPAAQVHAVTPLTQTQPTQAPTEAPAASPAATAAAVAAAAVATPAAPVTGIAADPFDDAPDDASAGPSAGVHAGGGDAGDDAFDAAKAHLIDRVSAFDPPGGATAAETADLKQDLQQMIDRFVPLPGESTSDALAALHAQYDDRVRDFTQDQKLDALIREVRNDNAHEAQQAHASQQADAPTVPTAADPAPTTGEGTDDPPPMNVPAPATAETMPPTPAAPDDAPQIELHPDGAVTNTIRTEATQILQQMETERREMFGGGIQDPQTTMQYYAMQQGHMAALQQLVSDQQAVALKTDGAMPSDGLLDRINAATVNLVGQANAAMMQASQQYASATGLPPMFMPPPLVPIPVVVPDVPDPTPVPDAEPAAAAEPPSAAYDSVATQVAAINQAMAAQAGANGLPFTPIQVPMDPAEAAPDLAAVNAAVAAQVAGANAQMAGMASAMNRPLVQIPIPTITLPDEAPTGTDPEAGQAGGPGADPGAGGAMGESGADAPSAAFDAVATQVAAINQAMAAQAGASGLPFTPIQVPMDPADAAPDLAAVNAAVAAQVANANAQLAGMASALNVPTVQIPTPTIVLPDGLGDTAMPSASEGAPQDTGAGGAMGESGADAPSAAYDAVATQVAAINQAMAAQAGASGLPFTPIQVPMDPLDAAPDLAAVNAALAAQVASANAQIAGTAAALGLPTVQIPTPTIVLPGGLGDTAVPSAGEGAAQAPTGASAGEAQGHGDAAAYQGAAATNEGAAAPDPGASGAADAATYGAATVAAANTAGMSSADQPSNGAISDGPGVAYAQGGAANVAAGEGAGAPEPAAGDDQDSGFRSAAGSGNTGIMDPFDAHVGQSATSQGAAAGSASTVPDAGGDYSGGGAAGDAGPSEKPSIPDPTDLPDILGGVDATNDISAPAPADDFDLPTIPDAPTGEAPPPPPPADMPALDLPDIPQIPDAPDVPDAPDLSQLPDLPDPPSPPSPPDFSSDDGPSFGDDIGNDVSPSDPTTTDF